MSDIQRFVFHDQIELEVQAHETDGFHISAPQVARALGFREAYDLLRSIPETEKGSELVRTPGGDQFVGYLTEPGFYRALGQRQAARIADPEMRTLVEDFQTWVYGTVIPSIRRTGSFFDPAVVSRKDLALMVFEAEERLEIEQAARRNAEEHAQSLRPSANAWNALADARGDYGVADAAKVLSRDPGILTGERRLFGFMAAQGWINRRGGRWRAYQAQVDNGRLVEKVNNPFELNGEMVTPAPTVRITPKGLRELHRLLGGAGELTAIAAT